MTAHTRTASLPGLPDHCGECSAAARSVIGWPCPWEAWGIHFCTPACTHPAVTPEASGTAFRHVAALRANRWVNPTPWTKTVPGDPTLVGSGQILTREVAERARAEASNPTRKDGA